MRSELIEEPSHSTNRHQNQFVEDIGQSVANALFGYTNSNENQTSTNEEESSSVRPKRSAKKVQQVLSSSSIYKASFDFSSPSTLITIEIRFVPFLLIRSAASATIRSRDDGLQLTE